ncbi:unnamed protein product [Cylicostephanus goldi]|uniref:Uncharacterized protein n=1 Tax=Cylicostephanus goldi TaxID=71465 RepID=A0A3P6S0G0_CYLGO|nr:unnamed protein product [Cylicostephanus goldi]
MLHPSALAIIAVRNDYIVPESIIYYNNDELYKALHDHLKSVEPIFAEMSIAIKYYPRASNCQKRRRIFAEMATNPERAVRL